MDTMTIGTGLVALLAIFAAIISLGLAAFAFGEDSRPSLDDRDQRPWFIATN
jgi:hypothetical protein